MPKNADPLFPVPWQWLKKYPYNWPAAAEEEEDGGRGYSGIPGVSAANLGQHTPITARAGQHRTLYKEIVLDKSKGLGESKI